MTRIAVGFAILATMLRARGRGRRRIGAFQGRRPGLERAIPRGTAKAVERRGDPRDPSNLIRLTPA